MEATHFIEQYRHWDGTFVSDSVFEIKHLQNVLLTSLKHNCTTIAIFKIKFK